MISEQEYNDVTASVNKDLAKQQGIPEAGIIAIGVLHKALDRILARPLYYYDSYQLALEEVERLEYTLQGLWGFPQDRAYHQYWWKMKGCECPDMNNYDALGTGRRYYNGECPVHKHLTEDKL